MFATWTCLLNSSKYFGEWRCDRPRAEVWYGKRREQRFLRKDTVFYLPHVFSVWLGCMHLPGYCWEYVHTFYRLFSVGLSFRMVEKYYTSRKNVNTSILFRFLFLLLSIFLFSSPPPPHPPPPNKAWLWISGKYIRLQWIFRQNTIPEVEGV